MDMIIVFNKHSARITVIAAIAAVMISLLGLGMTGCKQNESEREGLRVAADILPMADFCRNVGGETVEVEILIPAGASPHTYELTSEQMKFLSEADVLVTNGLGLTPWVEDLFAKLDNPELITVVAGEAVPQAELIKIGENKEEDHQHEQGVYDPHVWLDPNLAIYLVEAIRDAFIEADSDKQEIYRENASKYIEELEGLDGNIVEEVSAFAERKFVSFHPAWVYFAHRYGLEQIGVVEELPGKEPSAGEIAELVDLINEEGVKVIFTEPQFNPKAAETIAEETGAEVVLKDLDPVGDPDDPDKDTYIVLMKYNLGVMREVMK
jgi:ABC-type Zn uptake system ZnuABC Zn-binding protein ZnuA